MSLDPYSSQCRALPAMPINPHRVTPNTRICSKAFSHFVRTLRLRRPTINASPLNNKANAASYVMRPLCKSLFRNLASACSKSKTVLDTRCNNTAIARLIVSKHNRNRKLRSDLPSPPCDSKTMPINANPSVATAGMGMRTIAAPRPRSNRRPPHTRSKF